MWKNRSFAFHLTLTGSAVTLTGMLIAIFTNSLISYKALEEEVRVHSMPALVRTIESEFTENLAIAHSSLQYLARWQPLIHWIENGENPEEFKEISEMCQTVVELFGTGNINIVIDRSKHFYVGANLARQTLKPVDPVVDQWFYDFKTDGRKILTNLHAPHDQEYGGMAFVNARIEDRHGNFLGVVGAPFDMQGFEELLRTEKIGHLGRTFVVHTDGTVLLHTNPERINQRLEELPGFKDIAAQALQQEENLFYITDQRGRKLLVGSAPLQVMDGIIFTVVDEQELFHDINKARNYSLLAAIVIIIITVFAGIRLSRLITRPLQRVIKFADKVSTGNVSEPIAREGTKETRALADALNDMNLQLRSSNLSLKSVSKIFNGLNMSLMVTDPESGEILYSNDRLKQDFRFDTNPDGRKCWELLYHDKTERCADCSLALLEQNPDAIIRKEVRNTINGRLYEETCSFINWTSDSKAMLVQRLDITEANEAKEALQQRLDQLELAMAISQSLFSTEPATVLISNAINETGTFMGVGRLRIMRYDKENASLICDHEWLNPDDMPPSMLGKAVPYSASHPLFTKFFVELASHAEVNDTASMPGLMILPAAGVKAFLDIPIYVGGKIWGFIGADDCRGPHIWSNADIRMLRLISGMLSGLLFRKSAEISLLRMTSLVEEATQYITYVNMDGEFQFFNKRTCDLLGYTADELHDGGLPLIFSKNTMPYVRETIIPGIVREGKLSFELPVIRKDGVRRIFSFEAFSIGSGDDIGIGAIGLDVTEKRILEDELLSAKEAAEKSSRAKSAFLSRMSHEMRTPLNAVMGMASIALKADKPEKTRECLGKITDASSHLLGMINEILDMSNIEADKFVLNPKEFIFEALISKITDLVLPMAKEKRQTLSIKIASGMPYSIIADEQRLSQILGHLLSNAVKFTPEQGRVDMQARVLEETSEQCLLEFTVADTGIGISEENIATLFTPFEQIDGGGARKFGGAGLGLALSRKIVNMMGGRIDATSNNEGAVFTVTVSVAKGLARAGSLQNDDAQKEKTLAETPLATIPDAPPLSAPAAAASSTPQEEVSDDFSSYRILLAEDVEINCEIIASLLEPTGVGIDYAKNGKEAVEMFSKNPEYFHLIFMDINMPEMDGYEAVRQIRASGLKWAKDIPIIAMTANAFDEDIKKCLEVGMNGHLAKPIMFEQLSAIMREYLGRRAGQK